MEGHFFQGSLDNINSSAGYAFFFNTVGNAALVGLLSALVDDTKAIPMNTYNQSL